MGFGKSEVNSVMWFFVEESQDTTRSPDFIRVCDKLRRSCVEKCEKGEGAVGVLKEEKGN